MRKFILIVTAATLLIVVACKKKDAQVTADFTVSSAILKEGDKLILTSNCKNASSISWTGTYNNFTSTEKNPELVFDSAGDYSFTVNAVGSSSSASKTLSVHVDPDTLYRLRGNTKKTWIIESIIYNGSETQSAPCQKDDEFTLYHTGKDTFQITEGTNKCPDGTYIFQIPAGGDWLYTKAKKQLSFALVALGSPYNFDFVLSAITPTRLVGTDAINNVTIKMHKK